MAWSQGNTNTPLSLAALPLINPADAAESLRQRGVGNTNSIYGVASPNEWRDQRSSHASQTGSRDGFSSFQPAPRDRYSEMRRPQSQNIGENIDGVDWGQVFSEMNGGSGRNGSEVPPPGFSPAGPHSETPLGAARFGPGQGSLLAPLPNLQDSLLGARPPEVGLQMQMQHAPPALSMGTSQYFSSASLAQMQAQTAGSVSLAPPVLSSDEASRLLNILQLLQKQVSQAKSEAISAATERSNLAAQVEALNGKLRVLATQGEGASRDAAERGEQLAAVRIQLTASQSDLALSRSSAAEASAQVSQLREKLSSADRRARMAVEDKSEAERQARAGLEARDAALKECKSAQDEVIALKSEITRVTLECRKAVETARNATSDRDRERDKAAAAGASADKIGAELSKSIEARDAEVVRQKKLSDGTSALISALQATVGKATKDKGAWEESAAETRRALGQAKDAETTARAAMQGWRHKFVKMGQELTRAREQHARDRTAWEVIFEAMRRSLVGAVEAEGGGGAALSIDSVEVPQLLEQAVDPTPAPGSIEGVVEVSTDAIADLLRRRAVEFKRPTGTGAGAAVVLPPVILPSVASSHPHPAGSVPDSLDGVREQAVMETHALLVASRHVLADRSASGREVLLRLGLDCSQSAGIDTDTVMGVHGPTPTPAHAPATNTHGQGMPIQAQETAISTHTSTQAAASVLPSCEADDGVDEADLAPLELPVPVHSPVSMAVLPVHELKGSPPAPPLRMPVPIPSMLAEEQGAQAAGSTITALAKLTGSGTGPALSGPGSVTVSASSSQSAFSDKEDAYFDDPLRVPFVSISYIEADDEACLRRLQSIVKLGCPVDRSRDLKTLLYCVASGKMKCVSFLIDQGVRYADSDAAMRVAALAVRFAVESWANIDSKKAREEMTWRSAAGCKLVSKGCPLILEDERMKARTAGAGVGSGSVHAFPPVYSSSDREQDPVYRYDPDRSRFSDADVFASVPVILGVKDYAGDWRESAVGAVSIGTAGSAGRRFTTFKVAAKAKVVGDLWTAWSKEWEKVSA